MSTPLSLFEELTHQKHAGFPVTEVLTRLLQTAGHDVCLTKRNLHSSYWTVSRARDVCDTINELAGKAGDGESWDIFDKYTAMIVSLEQILWEFSMLAENESGATRLPAATAIQTDLEFIAVWRINRNALRDTVQKLLTSEYLTTGSAPGTLSEIKAIHRHDDSVLLKALSDVLGDYTRNMATPAATQTYFSIRKQLDAIQTTLTVASDDLADDAVVYCILTAMIIEIVASARDPQIGDCLHSVELWKRAARLVTLAEKHAKDVKLPVAPLQKEWHEFCAYLTAGVVVTLPETFKDLRILIAKIRRPYYAQSLALIAGCVELAPVFNLKKTFQMLTPFNLAIDDTTKALTAAADILYDPIAFVKDDDVASAFDTARDSVKKCFQQYKLDSGAFEEKFTKARDTDNSRLALLQARFKSKQVSPPAQQASIPLFLTISESGTGKPTTKTYTVEPSTLLSTILWKEASLRPLKQGSELRSKGFFQAGGKRLSLDSEIVKLPERDRRRSVTLTIP
ncbi:hypothetical protein DFH09DRAFT_1155521 [Mycena vulgaris]|nr:hypothetical protein DFH09DRAFT_1155521 [Mycena vulgaris]